MRPENDVLKTRLNVAWTEKYVKLEWWNIADVKRAWTDEVFELTKPWPMTGAKYVYAERYLERLSPLSALDFIANAHHVLVPTGRIRLSTTALERVIAPRLEKGDVDRLTGQTLAINRAFRGWGNKFIWSKALLEKALISAGFVEVNFFRDGESEDEELSELEAHGGYNVVGGLPNVWIVEAVKQTGPRDLSALKKLIETEFSKYVGE